MTENASCKKNSIMADLLGRLVPHLNTIKTFAGNAEKQICGIQQDPFGMRTKTQEQGT